VDEFDAKAAKKAEVAVAESDPWGGKSSGKPVTDCEGRLMSVAEARAQLQAMDEATTKAQGWLRGRDAARRLAAMQSLIGAYPKLQEGRVEARNPLQMLKDALWQQPQPKQVCLQNGAAVKLFGVMLVACLQL
jgi:hypothetical protein